MDSSLKCPHKRNSKGFMPFEINPVDSSMSCIKQPKKQEYLFVVLRSKWEDFKNELKRTEFNVTQYDSINPNLTFLTVHVEDAVYQKTAMALNLEAETRKYGFLTEYKAANKKDFYPFSQRQKHQMIEYLTRSELDIPKYCLFSSVIVIKRTKYL